MITHDLLRGMRQTDNIASESMRLSGITLEFEHYAVMIIEWCELDLAKLPTPERQTMQFALRETIEYGMGTAAHAYSYLPSRTRLVLLINAATPDDGLITGTALRAQAQLQPSGVRCMAAFGGWVGSQPGISDSYRAAQLNMEARIFCPPDTLITPALEECALPPALDELEARFVRDVKEGRASDAAACANQLVALWQKLPVCAGFMSLARFSNALKDVLIRMRYNVNGELPKLITDAKQAVWSIAEYPEAIQSFLSKALGSAETANAPRNDILFTKTVDYINEHIAEDLSLERISGAMHFNPKYFSRLFKDMAGMNLSDYITAHRLERAALLLRADSQRAIDEIARQVGYGSAQYFTRKFKEEYGMTPREYRLRMSHNGAPGSSANVD